MKTAPKPKPKPKPKPQPKPQPQPTSAATPPPAVPPRELVSFRELPDGGLEATLRRYGMIRICLPGSPLAIEVAVTRDTAKAFRCFLTTTVSGDTKQTDAARRANGGVTPGATYYLCADGHLEGAPTNEKSQQSKPGRKARAADGAAASGEPAA